MENFFHELKPVMMMVVVQIITAGVNIFYKLATDDGMSMRILVAYRFLFATAFLAPLAFFLERKSRPKLTWIVVFQSFLCGLFGCSLGQNLYVAGLKLTTTTFASAIVNLIPAFTFILAVAFGFERAAVRTLSGKLKVLGTLVSIGGAMLLIFYKGIEINLWSTHLTHLHHNPQSPAAKRHINSGNWILGSLLTLTSCLSVAIWLIIQAKLTENYPCHYSSTALICMMASIQALVFALCTERDWSDWNLGFNIRLLAVGYSGVISSGLIFILVTWCVRTRGPLFVAIFNPLMLVVVTIAASFLLDEKLHLGSILGAVLIVSGLYMVLWGKSNDMNKKSQVMPS